MTRRRRSAGQTIGGILVGFDQQVFRATKPPEELVESAKPLPPIAASDGSMLSIAFPEPAPGKAEVATAAREPGTGPSADMTRAAQSTNGAESTTDSQSRGPTAADVGRSSMADEAAIE